MNVDEIGKLIEQGRATQQSIYADSRYTEETRMQLGQAAWNEAAAAARAAVQGILADTDRRVADADARLQAATGAHESSINHARLLTLQNEWRALAEHGEFADVSRAVENAVRSGDALAIRAAQTAVPTLKARAKADFSPLRTYAGQIADLDRTLPAYRAELDPAPLKSARAAAEAAYTQRAETMTALQRIEARTGANGGPGVFASVGGGTFTETRQDGGIRITHNRGTMW
mgnify:CR=1 FL=1